MDCKDIENYISSSEINNVSSEELRKIYEHADNCKSCKIKLELEDLIKLDLVKHFASITPSLELINKINSLTINQNLRFKPILLAACLVFLLGIGIFIEKTSLGLSNIHRLHSLDSFHISSNNIDDLADYLKINLNKTHLVHFDSKGYFPLGASKIPKSFKGDMKLIALKNKDGNKISLCFLPRSYNLPYHKKTQIKDIEVHHGKPNSHNFIFWQGDKNTIALVSQNDMSHDELTNLAYNLIGEI